jgi:hypothetical protein
MQCVIYAECRRFIVILGASGFIVMLSVVNLMALGAARLHDTQHTETQHYDTQHNGTQHNDTK